MAPSLWSFDLLLIIQHRKTAEVKKFFVTLLPYLDATEVTNAPLRVKGNE
jgi:hypothetical protein